MYQQCHFSLLFLLYMYFDCFAEAERRWNLQRVLTQYYDMKTVLPELLRAVRDSLFDPEEIAWTSELMKDAVSFQLKLPHRITCGCDLYPLIPAFI